VGDPEYHFVADDYPVLYVAADAASRSGMGYIKMATAVGSILHGNTCLRHPDGSWCAEWPTMVTGEIPIVKIFRPAAMQWNKAVWNVHDHRFWMDTYGPYPTDADAMRQFSDDLRQVPNRPSKMAKVGVWFGEFAAPDLTEPYQDGETKQSAHLFAPKGAFVDPYDDAYCSSKTLHEDHNLTGQRWGICN